MKIAPYVLAPILFVGSAYAQEKPAAPFDLRVTNDSEWLRKVEVFIDRYSDLKGKHVREVREIAPHQTYVFPSVNFSGRAGVVVTQSGDPGKYSWSQSLNEKNNRVHLHIRPMGVIETDSVKEAEIPIRKVGNVYKNAVPKENTIRKVGNVYRN